MFRVTPAAVLLPGLLLLGSAGTASAQYYYGPVTSYYGPAAVYAPPPAPAYLAPTYVAPGYYGTYVRAPFVSVNIGPRYVPPVVAAPPVVVSQPRVISRRVITPAGGVVTGYRGVFDDDFEIRYPDGTEVEYEFEDGRWEIEIDD